MKWIKGNLLDIIVVMASLIGAYLTTSLAIASNTKDIDIINNKTIPQIENRIVESIEQNKTEHFEIKQAMSYQQNQTDKKLDRLEEYLIRIDNKLDQRILTLQRP